jgi:hypothetical protein
MKLFKSLLVAPATLGLLAPMSATANEVTINDFNAAEEIAVTNGRVDGLEARFNNLEAGSFSSTTSAEFGTTFYVGAIDEGNDDGVTTFTYDFSMDLTTSFTGDDELSVAIVGGNATTAVDGVMDGELASFSSFIEVDDEEVDVDLDTPDYLVLDGISYTFPLGGFTVALGDGVGVDELNTGACSYSAFTDDIGDCGTPSIGGAADSAVATSYDFGNGFTVAGGVGFASERDGILTTEDESTIGLEAAYTADAYGVAIAYTDDDETAGDGSFYSIQAAWTPDAPYSVSVGYEFDDDDADSYFLGVTSEVGPGSLSLGGATQGLADDHDNNMMYELAYEYPVNDGMTVTPGVFVIEGDTDAFGAVVTTSFSF